MASVQEVFFALITIAIGMGVSLVLTLLIEARSRRKKHKIESLIRDIGADAEPVAKIVDLTIKSEGNDKREAFIVLIIDVERKLREFAVLVTGLREPKTVSSIIDTLIENDILEEKWRDSFRTLWNIRTRVVHGTGVTDTEIKYGSALAASLKLDLERIEKERKLQLPISIFEIYKDAAGKYRWRLRAPNGEIVAVSEAYESIAGCENGIKFVQKSSRGAIVQKIAE